MTQPTLRRLEKLVDSFVELRLLVVGDVVLDEYLWGEVERVSPEAPVPVVHVKRESLVLGAAGNVVRNVLALGSGCRFCTAVGDDRTGDRVVALLDELGIDPAGLVRVSGRPTTRKTRVVASSQQVVRFDRETLDPLPDGAIRALERAVEAGAPHVQGAVLADYGKGVFSTRAIRGVLRRLDAAGVPVAVDPKAELRAYRDVELVKPNLREAEALAGLRARAPGDLERIAASLRRTLGRAALVVTRGADGMTLFDGDGPGLDVHTPPREVFDVQGAGDTSITALALSLRAGASLFEAAVIANAAAGVVVGKVGTATVTPEELKRQLPAALDAARRRP